MTNGYKFDQFWIKKQMRYDFFKLVLLCSP